ncbi:lysophospholipid acyltransferase family protein [Sphingomicrobium nitratireducens]|uniref:lysophospholipid acyltransferase family protein n=1 Tax=Sphingomicrobium nitratireducens TaxID=2964666 RepID=UPI0022402C40|nr:lysophospholipid acyltransferase family protein [Sphingomicrobium nitratireducens]
MGEIRCDPNARLSLAARLVRWLLIGLYRLRGWSIDGSLPDIRKFVLAGASHTSNWDFIVFLGVTDELGIRPRFMGKNTLFRWPMKQFMCGLGGVPVDRSARKDMVAQMADQFAAHDEFALVVAIEGTRSPTRHWKSGFYRIAEAAGVPIVCVGPDYERRRGVIGPVIHPSGNYEADLAKMIAFFRTLKPRHPERALFPDDPEPPESPA